MPTRVDWTKRAGYIWTRHGVRVTWAEEAISDDLAVWLRPDPASRSGHSVRVIGYSPAAGDVLTVIVLDAGADPAEPPVGDWWGSDAWRANDRDRQIYSEGG